MGSRLDRSRMLAVGRGCGRCFFLTSRTSSDRQEVTQAVHVMQDKLLPRPPYRKYLELAKQNAEDESFTPIAARWILPAADGPRRNEVIVSSSQLR